MTTLPQEVLLLIVKHLPIDELLADAFLGMKAVFGFNEEVVSLGFVTNHWKLNPPQTFDHWDTFPVFYQYVFTMLEIMDLMSLPEDRLRFCREHQLICSPLSFGTVMLAEPHIRNNKTFLVTMLAWASFNAYIPLMELLLTIENLGNETFLVAANDKNWVVAERLLFYGAVDPSFNDNKCLELVIQAGKLDLANFILSDDRVNPCLNRYAVLTHAMKHPRILKTLLNDHRMPTYFQNMDNLLEVALRHNNHPAFSVLLKSRKFHPSSDLFLPAILCPYQTFLKALIQDGRVPLDELFLLCLENSLSPHTRPAALLILSSNRWDPKAKLEPRLSTALNVLPHQIVSILVEFPPSDNLPTVCRNALAVCRTVLDSANLNTDIFIIKYIRECKNQTMKVKLTEMLLQLPRITTKALGLALSEAERNRCSRCFTLLYADPRLQPNAAELAFAAEIFHEREIERSHRLLQLLDLSDHTVNDVLEFLNDTNWISVPRNFQEPLCKRIIQLSEDSDYMNTLVIPVCNHTNLATVGNNQLLLLTAKNGCTALLRFLLTFVDPSIPDCKCIQVASKHGQADCVQLLLQDDRVNPNANNSYSLLNSLKDKRPDITNILLQDSRTDVSLCVEEYFTLACQYGHLDIVVNQIEAQKMAPTVFHLEEALQFGQESVALYLLQNYGQQLQPSEEHLWIASATRLPKVVSELLNTLQIDPSQSIKNTFLRAVTNGFGDIVEVYLRLHSNLVKSNWLCLALDARSEQEQILFQLLQVPGLDASVNNNRCIRVCLEKGYWKAVDVLLSRNEVIGQVNNPELFLAACKAGRVDVVEKLGALGIGKWLTFDVIDEASDEGHETIMDCLMKLAAELI
ncbi:hypothetical protein BCR33DRAFT_723418 [Rhizoclosmatium globosum]|uniref:F-box domain-containing protein n=1 Tax=Rhizoclosmatium globosum TaxID=329046 RepID=A0A1Y2BE55_9FUNG|nr:hypothetical protein BCR33DRAFT_723418 [Rhizoclosmatium globosum]|eukprot:ORY32767.1 hypothetical protein BCR33DRAFT_723418 [Rhizoclosmatium globosum]